MPRRPSSSCDELGWRRDLGIGPERPVTIIHVELEHHVSEIDIGFPIGIERADIAPIFLDLLGRRGCSFDEKRWATALPCLTI